MAIESINPATEEVLARYDEWAPSRVDAALARAASTQVAWRETSFGERDVSGRFRCTLTAVRTDGWRVAAVHIGARLDGAR